MSRASSSSLTQSPSAQIRIERSAEFPVADLSNDWKVTFTSTGKSETEPTLTDWTADPATVHYSGEVVYARDFTIAASRLPSILK